MKKFVCPRCGKKFTPSSPWQKYCSDECKHQAKLARMREQNRANRERSKEDPYREPLIPPRHCHDCGRETYNYRCNFCRVKWQIKHGVISRDMYDFIRKRVGNKTSDSAVEDAIEAWLAITYKQKRDDLSYKPI